MNECFFVESGNGLLAALWQMRKLLILSNKYKNYTWMEKYMFDQYNTLVLAPLP
jgi:hypothetical protein